MEAATRAGIREREPLFFLVNLFYIILSRDVYTSSLDRSFWFDSERP